MSDNINKEINELTFESALKALEDIVRQLDDGSIDLDKAVEAYEKGAKLKKHCEKKLQVAQLRIEKIEVDKNGDLSSKVMDTE